MARDHHNELRGAVVTERDHDFHSHIVGTCTAEPTPTFAIANPAIYPVFGDTELDERATAAEALTPGCSITLDSFGLLSSAVCNVCGGKRSASFDSTPFTDETAHVDYFLSKQKTITGLESAETKKLGYGSEGQLQLFQKTPAGSSVRSFAAAETALFAGFQLLQMFFCFRCRW